MDPKKALFLEALENAGGKMPAKKGKKSSNKKPMKKKSGKKGC